ncbi:MAG: peptide chain release factor N(5)-glutamine methyltransferase [Defluviitaleaceae bacterium]|nr:peptide chain release factor N(5)-glutamine methyltransferase [Defluviitaleaceae bacterium]
MTIKEAFISHDSHETIWMLEKVTGLSTTQLRLADENSMLSPESEKFFLHMIEQRNNGMPLQYILGEWEFMGLPMRCCPGVLIPRGDTEVLASEAIGFLQSLPGSLTALDMCTGSGCIGISMAHFCPELRVTATDIDYAPLALAQENAELNGVSDRLAFVQSDLFEHISGQYHCITANPPYIATEEIETLSKEVKHEPVLALDGGLDGLDFYRAIIPASKDFLLSDGGLFLEIGDTQGEAVAEMMRCHGFKNVVIVNDIENRHRVVRGMM